MSGGDERAGVSLTNLDEPLFDGADATKRDLVDYLDAMADRMLPVLRDRPLSVIRALRGRAPFMQKNVPSYTPSWIRTVGFWAAASKREVQYALCDDRPTLLWFANQRAIEYHVTLVRASEPDRPTHLVVDLDPPAGAAFDVVVRTARLVYAALGEAGLAGAVKTSGSKGAHIVVPIEGATVEEAAAATRALAARAERLDPSVATTAYVRTEREGKVFVDSTRVGGATVVAAYSPRIRPGTPVSFPVAWSDLDAVSPADFALRRARELLAGGDDPWARAMPAPQALGAQLVAEGEDIPVARVQAMHEGKRRARERRAAEDGPDA